MLPFRLLYILREGRMERLEQGAGNFPDEFFYGYCQLASREGVTAELMTRAWPSVAGRLLQVAVHQNIDAPDFWGLLAIAGVLIGNSSAGLIETPYFHLPAVNVGQRQHGRAHAENVINCEPNRVDIISALVKALDDPSFSSIVACCSLPFGDGLAWKRVLDCLNTVELGPRLLDKRMTY